MTIRAKLKKPQPPTSSDDGVGSVVLKGFTVPSGFVLHYTTSTGSGKSAREGDFVNSNHRFQEVRDGKIPGWNLQKVQSDFSFEVAEEETTLDFEDHTFTPWGEKISVLGVPVLPKGILRKITTVKQLGGVKYKYLHPEIEEYVAEIRKFLETTYSVKSGLSEVEVLELADIINRNINLLLTLESTPYIKRMFDITNPPDVTNPDLDSTLNPNSLEKVSINNMSSGLLANLCANAGITREEFISEVSSGISRADFENKYGQYVKVNSVKIDDMLYTKDEARSFIEESLSGIPQEIRPIVMTYLGGADLIGQTIDEVIRDLKDADYFFTEIISSDYLDDLAPKDNLTLYDLRKTKVEGYDLIPGRFEILKRVMSREFLLKLLKKGSDDGSNSEQSVQDVVSEIIENYIEYLGGDVRTYKNLMSEWLSGEDSVTVQVFKDWVSGKNSPEVKSLRSTFEAIQSAHSDLYTHVMQEAYAFRPVDLGVEEEKLSLTELSIVNMTNTVAFSLDEIAAREYKDNSETAVILLAAKVPTSKLLFIPGLYMAKPYWKKVKGKPVYVTRDEPERDTNAEIIVKSSNTLIKRKLDTLEVEVVL